MLSHFSSVQLFATLWTIACQALLSMGFSRQESLYWSPFPPPGNLPDQGSEPVSLMSPVLANGFFTASATWEAQEMQYLGALSKNDRMISVLFQGKPFNITSNPTLYSKHLCWRAEVDLFYEDLQHLLELTLKERCLFNHNILDCKCMKSRETWTISQVWPCSMKWSRAKANRILSREHTGHDRRGCDYSLR